MGRAEFDVGDAGLRCRTCAVAEEWEIVEGGFVLLQAEVTFGVAEQGLDVGDLTVMVDEFDRW